MFGTLVTNRQLKELRKTKELLIDPFDESNLKSTHYTLQAGSILRHDSDGKLTRCHSFEDNCKSPYKLEPNAYVVIEPRQMIRLMNPGIVGRFIAPSTMIESGVALVAGQISNNYGEKGEKIRFGLKNFSARDFLIDENFRVAHIEFFDLRGISIDTVTMTKAEAKAWAMRLMKAIDDGVDYGDGS